MNIIKYVHGKKTELQIYKGIMKYSPDLFLAMMTVMSMRKDAFIITINMLTEAIMAGTTMLLPSVGIRVAGCIYRKSISFITRAQNFSG